jgi:uncharacterized protein
MLTISQKSSNTNPTTAQKPEITYPCVWLYKVIGEDSAAITRAISTICPDTLSILPSKTSASGKYCSLNVEIEVADEATRLAIYQNLKNHFAIKMVL